MKTLPPLIPGAYYTGNQVAEYIAEATSQDQTAEWVALAKAAEAINQSPLCSEALARELCDALDRLSSAILGEEKAP